MVYITKGKFLDFEDVRVSGVTNMWNTKTICGLTDLTPEEVRIIRRDYGRFKEKYL